MLEEIIRSVFGYSAHIIRCEVIADGYRNTTYKLVCDAYDKALFLKMERPFGIPRTQKHQIRRELAGIALCAAQGVSVPRVVASDVEGVRPWILEEFEVG